MSGYFPSSDRGSRAFTDLTMQETGEKCWATLKPEEKKEIITSIAKAVAAVFVAIILTGGLAGCIAAGSVIAPLYILLIPAAGFGFCMGWLIAINFIDDAVKTVQKHLPPRPAVEIIE